VRLMEEIAENRLLSRWAAALPRSPKQVGAIHETDAELLPLGDGRLLALTVDTVSEEVQTGLYRLPRTAGRIAATASLSDLAAVGAEPAGMLLSVSLPRDATADVQREVAEGVAEVCRAADTFVLGGDTSEASELSISAVAVGFVPADGAMTRLGLRPSDLLFSSGPLGSGEALLGLSTHDEAHWQPRARLAEGRALRGIASACMDTSDGLVSTLDQLARLNGIALRVTVPLPSLLERSAEGLRATLGISALPFLAAEHGEYQLVFGVPPDRLRELETRAHAISWRPTFLGRVEPGVGLFMGGTPIDGAFVRNLRANSAGDFPAYVRALCALGA
jgi:thiamine-monophosphate kinase